MECTEDTFSEQISNSPSLTHRLISLSKVINTEAIYDEIKDISLHADSGTSESTMKSVYATAQLPTGLYDNLTFSSAEQTTQLTGADVAFSSSDTVTCASVQHPGNFTELQTCCR